MTAPSSRPDTPAQEHADTLRGALAQLRGILRVHVLPADDALDSLDADLEAAREALRWYVNQHDLLDRDRRCACSYCNAGRAALARLSAGKATSDE